MAQWKRCAPKFVSSKIAKIQKSCDIWVAQRPRGKNRVDRVNGRTASRLQAASRIGRALGSRNISFGGDSRKRTRRQPVLFCFALSSSQFSAWRAPAPDVGNGPISWCFDAFRCASIHIVDRFYLDIVARVPVSCVKCLWILADILLFLHIWVGKLSVDCAILYILEEETFNFTRRIEYTATDVRRVIKFYLLSKVQYHHHLAFDVLI